MKSWLILEIANVHGARNGNVVSFNNFNKMKTISRLEFLKSAGFATAGMIVGGKVSAETLPESEGIYQEPQARQQQTPEQRAAALARQNTLQGPITAKGKIGNMEFSRLILGGNPIGGWLHSRDLSYVGALARAYLTDEKKMEVFQMAENCGVDTILGHPVMIDVLNKYWSRGIGKIKWLSDCGGGGDLATSAQLSIDGGCVGGYTHGSRTDGLVQNGDFKSIEQGLDVFRKAGMPAGIGAHKIETLIACVANGLIPDFWMKTFHHLDYWSAFPNEPARDNRYCDDPQGVIDFFAERKEPFIAFKVLAAGAIPAASGIRFGLENGGDFVCLGMFDFNMIQDVNLFNEIMGDLGNRKRPWCA